VGALSYLNDNKIKIPEQKAVIGFSNWFMSQVITPKLSTIDQPSHEMGKIFSSLLEKMNCHRESLLLKNNRIRYIRNYTRILTENKIISFQKIEISF
jgi:LacI family transcriptional regulator